jgi:hypothetical protein
MRTPITHPLNVTYLVVGLIFLGISGSWALRTAGIIDNRDVGWLLPLVLVTAGVVGLAAFASKSLGRTRDDDDPDDLDDLDDLDDPEDIWSDTTEGDLR